MDYPSDPRDPAYPWRVKCDYCGSKPHNRCGAIQGTPRIYPHADRVKLAQAQAKKEKD
jgi:hypothetical protein